MELTGGLTTKVDRACYDLSRLLDKPGRGEMVAAFKIVQGS
jgi:hypothetical protein